MRSVRLYLTIMILFLVILALPSSASAFPHYKVAVLPTINTADLKNTEISNLIEHKIHRKLRFPFYEIIPNIEIAYAIKALTTKNDSIIPNQITLALLSQTLSADIVLVPEIIRARADLHHFSSVWGNDDETIETTDVFLRCYAYSTKDNKYYIIKAEKYNSTLLNLTSGLLTATSQVIDELLKKLPFETIPTTRPLTDEVIN